MSMTYDDLCKITRDVHSRFTYVSDIQQFGKNEHWMSFKEIPEGNFNGDCDDFAQAVRKEIDRQGEWSSLAVCGVNSNSINHCVCIYDGKWVIDNIHKWPMLKSDLLNYKFISMLDSMGDWRTIDNG